MIVLGRLVQAMFCGFSLTPSPDEKRMLEFLILSSVGRVVDKTHEHLMNRQVSTFGTWNLPS